MSKQSARRRAKHEALPGYPSTVKSTGSPFSDACQPVARFFELARAHAFAKAGEGIAKLEVMQRGESIIVVFAEDTAVFTAAGYARAAQDGKKFVPYNGAKLESSLQEFETIPNGTHVTWHSRGAIGHGTVVGIHKKGKTAGETEYTVRQHDHFKGEPDTLHYYGHSLRRAEAARPEWWTINDTGRGIRSFGQDEAAARADAEAHRYGPEHRRVYGVVYGVNDRDGYISQTRAKHETGHKFHVGDRVGWHYEGGTTSGKITHVHTKDFDVAGHTQHASPENPQYEIQSDHGTDHVAYHYGKTLHKLGESEPFNPRDLPHPGQPGYDAFDDASAFYGVMVDGTEGVWNDDGQWYISAGSADSNAPRRISEDDAREFSKRDGVRVLLGFDADNWLEDCGVDPVAREERVMPGAGNNDGSGTNSVASESVTGDSITFRLEIPEPDADRMVDEMMEEGLMVLAYAYPQLEFGMGSSLHDIHRLFGKYGNKFVGAIIEADDIKKGAFHRWLGKSEDSPITAADIKRGLASKDPHVRKMAQFAKNMQHQHESKHRVQREAYMERLQAIREDIDGGALEHFADELSMRGGIDARINDGEIVIPCTNHGDCDFAQSFIDELADEYDYQPMWWFEGEDGRGSIHLTVMPASEAPALESTPPQASASTSPGWYQVMGGKAVGSPFQSYQAAMTGRQDPAASIEYGTVGTDGVLVNVAQPAA